MEFSVVIPTYNRVEILGRTLQALARQRSLSGLPELPFRYEVIVVDDGSTDSTRRVVTDLRTNYPVDLTYLSQPNRKQGAARNLGVTRAGGRRIVFLGDDTVPCAGFLAEHWRSLESAQRETVVIGYTPWASSHPKTAFLHYIGELGWQFGFSLIDDPSNLPFNFFYTSNLSIERDFFQQSGGFDESFQEYGWEDMELGWRLKKKGMTLVYNDRAIAQHHHPTTLGSFVQRQRKVGYSAWTFYKRHPELEEFLNVHKVPRYSALTISRMWLLTQACRLTEKVGRPDLSRYYPDLLSYHYNRGIQQGRDDALS